MQVRRVEPLDLIVHALDVAAQRAHCVRRHIVERQLPPAAGAAEPFLERDARAGRARATGTRRPASARAPSRASTLPFDQIGAPLRPQRRVKRVAVGREGHAPEIEVASFENGAPSRGDLPALELADRRAGDRCR